MAPETTRPHRLLGRGSLAEVARIAGILRRETVGGGLLVAGALLALVWANSPWSAAYTSLSEFTVGPAALHLHLNLATWAADGLLAIFFFVAGLELKREFVAGDLRDPARAALPVAAAFGGVMVPAVVFVVLNLDAGDDALVGWAIPTATDIAFALAVLAIIGTHLPAGLRTFLLTLAVVDDLIAITIIAVFYTQSLSPVPLLLAVLPLVLFTVLVQRRVRSWWLLLPLAVVAWGLVHASGVHATVAGILLGFAVPVIRSDAAGGPDAGPGLAEHFEHRFRPISSGVRGAGLRVLRRRRLGGRRGRARSEPGRLGDPGRDRGPGRRQGRRRAGVDLAGCSGSPALSSTRVCPGGTCWGWRCWPGSGSRCRCWSGSSPTAPAANGDDHVKLGVLAGSLLSALLATVVLRTRNRAYRRKCEAEDRDAAPSARLPET